MGMSNYYRRIFGDPKPPTVTPPPASVAVEPPPPAFVIEEVKEIPVEEPAPVKKIGAKKKK